MSGLGVRLGSDRGDTRPRSLSAHSHEGSRGRIALLMLFEAATLALIASLHLTEGLGGGRKPFRPAAAGIAEAIIGVVLVCGAAALLRGSRQARTIALAATAFAILGFVVGLTFTVRGGGTVDIAYHATLLPLLILTLLLLLSEGERR